jgi:hypothetical protein
MATKPNYTQPALAVTDGAEVTIVAHSFCSAIYASETPTASGWPRGFLYRAPMPGSAQHPQAPGTSYRIPGPFAPGDSCGTLELKSAGGDSSTFNIAELMA